MFRTICVSNHHFPIANDYQPYSHSDFSYARYRGLDSYNHRAHTNSNRCM